ncbi:BadM/Rrf2 family transcriptional regulator [Burkholderia pseudomallei]|nr:BadM/Rrf2 family transcriptional regulator [Burkholderia pseudomallei]
MNTSSRFAFAVHVLALLSLQEGVPLSSEVIAGSVNTNPALIRRLLSKVCAICHFLSQCAIFTGLPRVY